MTPRSGLLHRDVILGALLAAFGLTAAIIAARYPYGSAREMGPGFIPYWLGLVIASLGVLIAGCGLLVRQPEPMARPAGLVLLLIPGAILLFGIAIDRLGLLLTAWIASFAVAMAWPDIRRREAAIAATVLAVAMTLIFVYALRVPMPVWPR
jgi:Tripartite tricarboxylate transporter TctB family